MNYETPRNEETEQQEEKLAKDIEKFCDIVNEATNDLDITRDSAFMLLSKSENSVNDLAERIYSDRRRLDTGVKIDMNSYAEEISFIKKTLEQSSDDLTSGHRIAKPAENIYEAESQIDRDDRSGEQNQSINHIRELTLDAAAKLEKVIGQTSSDASQTLSRTIRTLSESYPQEEIPYVLSQILNQLSETSDILAHGKRKTKDNSEISDELFQVKKIVRVLTETIDQSPNSTESLSSQFL